MMSLRTFLASDELILEPTNGFELPNFENDFYRYTKIRMHFANLKPRSEASALLLRVLYPLLSKRGIK
jgi:hypothetical protein